MLEQEVQSGKIAGAVAAVARHGRLGYLQAVGNRDADQPMQTDTLFRIASMTKQFTAVAVQMRRDDPRRARVEAAAHHGASGVAVEAVGNVGVA